MSRPETTAKDEKVGMDDLAEDMFGLNIRGVHTLWALLRKPGDVFAAARKPDWTDRRYTPSIRLVFSIIAAMAALRFIWSGPESYLFDVTRGLIENRTTFESEAALNAFTDDVLDTYVFLFPLVLMAGHALASLFLRIWGKGTPLVVRIRLYFSALVPGTFFSLLSTTLLGVGNEWVWFAYAAGSIVVVFAIDMATAWRGGVAGIGPVGKGSRALVFAITSFVVAMVTNALAYTGSSAWVSAFG